MSLSKPKVVSLAAASDSTGGRSAGKNKRRADGSTKPLPASALAATATTPAEEDEDDATSSIAASDISLEDDDGAEDDMSDVQVSFDFFSLESRDFHALNTLLRQLLGPDAGRFEFGELADVLWEDGLGGTSAKVLDEDDADQAERGADPYAFVVALDLADEMPEQADLWQYLRSRIAGAAGGKAVSDQRGDVRKWLDLIASNLARHPQRRQQRQQQQQQPQQREAKADARTAALILGERLINMPIEVAPALYGYLQRDLLADGVRGFEHYVLLSRCYTHVASLRSDDSDSSVDEDDDEQRDAGKRRVVSKATAKRLAREKRLKAKAKSKTTKSRGMQEVEEVEYFHPEDAVLREHALASCVFAYAQSPGGGGGGGGGEGRVSDSRRAFSEHGLKESGLVMVFDTRGWDKAVQAVMAAFGGIAPVDTV